MASKKSTSAVDEHVAEPEVDPADEGFAGEPERLLIKRTIGAPLARNTKLQYVRQVMMNIRENMPLESSCFCAGITPEELRTWMDEDPRMNLSIMRQVAFAQRDLVRKLKRGGQGMGEAKAALEILTRLYKDWASKSVVTLQDGLKDALDELEREFDGPTYERILRVIQRNSK